MTFTTRHADWLSGAALRIHRATQTREMCQAFIESVDRVFHLHSVACEELGGQLSNYQLHSARLGTAPPRDHVNYYHDNPFGWVLTSAAPPPWLHLNHQVPRRRWHKTDHYNGLARPMGWNDQLMLIAQSRPTLVVCGLYRDRPFSATERHLLALLQPHLQAAWARTAGRNGRLQVEVPELLTDDKFRAYDLGGAHERLFGRYFPGRGDTPLPTDLLAWLQARREQLRAKPPLTPPSALRVDSAWGSLYVRLFPMETGYRIRFTEVPASPDFFLLRRHGLTTRECEVLHWLAQGKRDLEIAQILHLARRTVSKHVENVLRKLAAENRTAAVAMAEAWLAHQVR